MVVCVGASLLPFIVVVGVLSFCLQGLLGALFAVALVPLLRLGIALALLPRPLFVRQPMLHLEEGDLLAVVALCGRWR